MPSGQTHSALGFRVVEAQTTVATASLVDGLEELEVLEAMLEESKPSTLVPGYHYLIASPFRYPPLRYGSRFGSTMERGIFYGSETLETAFAETAFYALLFVADSEGLQTLSVWKTAFVFAFDSSAMLDATTPEHADKGLDAPANYAASQAFGSEARDRGVQVIRFTSARCPNRGANLAVFEPRALAPAPRSSETWRMLVRSDRVDCLQSTGDRRCSFSREGFLSRGAGAHPGGHL